MPSENCDVLQIISRVEAVEHPEIPEVLNLGIGAFQMLADVVGTDYAQLMALRLSIKDAQQVGRPLYACAECYVPVTLLMHSESRRFYFKHTMEDGRCSAVTRGELNQVEINARKYNGAKESRLHIRMKQLVVKSLSADPRFTDITVEKRWSAAITGAWRKPDVQAIYLTDTGESVRIAFEVQLSTTYLDVIAERRRFYLGEKGLLFWVFSEFNDTGRKLMQDDVFYNNNQNAFIVTEATAQLSLENSVANFDCAWSEPVSTTTILPLQRKTVSFRDLTFDLPRQRVFYFDFDGVKQAHIEAEQSSLRAVRDRFEEGWIDCDRDSRPVAQIWQEFYRGVRGCGIRLPDYPKDPYHVLVSALYSAKHGRVIGWRFKQLVEVAHRIAGGHPRYLRIFRLALKVYGRGSQLKSEDKSGKWQLRLEKCIAAVRSGDETYAHDREYDEAIAILFPELFSPVEG